MRIREEMQLEIDDRLVDRKERQLLLLKQAQLVEFFKEEIEICEMSMEDAGMCVCVCVCVCVFIHLSLFVSLALTLIPFYHHHLQANAGKPDRNWNSISHLSHAKQTTCPIIFNEEYMTKHVCPTNGITPPTVEREFNIISNQFSSK